MMAKKANTSKGVPGKKFDGAHCSSNPNLAKSGGTGNNKPKGPLKSYTK
jgi:hypothetical protein